MNSISPIGVSSINSLLNNQTNNQTNKTDDKSFSELLNNAITEVNGTQVDAYNAMEGIATGKVKNLQEAVQKIEEADLSLKLALEVKNKALAAYKEIKSMQI
ncbi:flagellar hook-basal body complex protein FliE [Halarcobacter ebronensis]|uniref:Flagellar hook-basal body complex protein FliE n=1 Tax=Halarcobacter ebronensis TaxID=1462615 RepID=A0A4Q1AYU4_9BACT|nr:flagellar hook-basal body complex protein FliE [Halarcobacter ebronensis]QKF82894.1 flagellar proximal rod protein FliE [Halarcobacter ebronensis]RXK06911.1 flagellar hook-basal body complex protein FliE [Halarcobacter ebronensis]